MKQISIFIFIFLIYVCLVKYPTMFYSYIECAKKRQNNNEIELKKKIEKASQAHKYRNKI